MEESKDLPETRQYGTVEGAGWTVESLSYKRNPTIENYVALRRANPEAEIEVHTHGGIDQLFCVENELRNYGIDPDRFVSVFDADQDEISYYALFFLEKIIETKQLERQGETHLIGRGLAIPGKPIDWFITCSLDAASYYGTLEINRDLIVLIKERLGGPFPEYETKTKVKEQRLQAVWIGGQMLASGQRPTLRTVAYLLDVSPSTVMRWFERGEFEKESEMWSHHFRADGGLRLSDKGVKPLRQNERAQHEDD